jgi:hypothetical protein
MVIRETIITECWCSHCGSGMTSIVNDASFMKGIQLKEMIGNGVVCNNCQKENIIEDIIIMIPTEFIVSGLKENKLQTKHRYESCLRDRL